MAMGHKKVSSGHGGQIGQMVIPSDEVEEARQSMEKLFDMPERPEGFYTTKEWRDQLGFGYKRTRAYLKRMVADGLMETIPVAVELIEGQSYRWAPGYKMLKARKK